MSKSLADMLTDLMAVDDEIWGLYAFSRDVLKDRISEEDKRAWSIEAAQCGEYYALRVMEKFHTMDAFDIAAQMGLDVKMEQKEKEQSRLLFAMFVPPKEIFIMEEPIKKAKNTFEALESQGSLPILKDRYGKPLEERDIAKIILSHEIFHFLEEEYQDEIFTRRKKITLWTLPIIKFKNESTIRALGDIAAMSFARKINGLSFSPFLLDVFIYYGYNPDASCSIYDEIMKMIQ